MLVFGSHWGFRRNEAIRFYPMFPLWCVGEKAWPIPTEACFTLMFLWLHHPHHSEYDRAGTENPFVLLHIFMCGFELGTSVRLTDGLWAVCPIYHDHPFQCTFLISPLFSEVDEHIKNFLNVRPRKCIYGRKGKDPLTCEGWQICSLLQDLRNYFLFSAF